MASLRHRMIAWSYGMMKRCSFFEADPHCLQFLTASLTPCPCSSLSNNTIYTVCLLNGVCKNTNLIVRMPTKGKGKKRRHNTLDNITGATFCYCIGLVTLVPMYNLQVRLLVHTANLFQYCTSCKAR